MFGIIFLITKCYNVTMILQKGHETWYDSIPDGKMQSGWTLANTCFGYFTDQI